MYLSAKEFQEKLIDANIQSFNVKSSFVSKDFPIQNGLIFDSNNEKAKILLDTLEKLKLLKTGYVKLKIGNQIAIIQEDQNNPLKTFQFSQLPAKALSIKQIVPLQNDNTGTIMLGLGSKSIFEMQKRNTLFFLMSGLNVMMFNYRGHGLSEGQPSPEGTYKDVEAAYQYLKQVHKIEDKQIIAKGFCLSGGIMAHLASKHPEINLFLDQTYAEIKNLALRKADDIVQKILNLFPNQNENIKPEKGAVFKIIKSLIVPAIKLLSPKYTTLKGIEKTKGRVLILESREDILTPREELKQILGHAAKNGTLQQITVASIPGGHGSQLADAKEEIEGKTYNTGKALINHFLSSLNFYNPIIPTKKVKDKDIVSPATKKEAKKVEQALDEERIEKYSQNWEEIDL
ncbi:MAG TPA: hypothetical protein PLC42_07150 [Parachlamydiaceae bacterium]|nr:hypothetical protein [Parachlamydiaceae bacterium]